MSTATRQLGWIHDPEAVAEVVGRRNLATLYATAPPVAGFGAGKIVLPYQAQRAYWGAFLSYVAQTRGTCVARSGQQIGDILRCMAVANDARQQINARVAFAPLYAGARIETGYGPRRGDGATGAGLAAFMTGWGLLEEIAYTIDGKTYDLSQEDDALAASWGSSSSGVPAALEAEAKTNPILRALQVHTWEEMRDGIAAGGVGVLCCNSLFSCDRDSDGFSKVDGSGGHATPVIGIDDDYKRPGGLVDYRSWGNFGSGPKRHDQPDSTTWVDAEKLNKLIGDYDDSWVFFDPSGFVAEPIKHSLRKAT